MKCLLVLHTALWLRRLGWHVDVVGVVVCLGLGVQIKLVHVRHTWALTGGLHGCGSPS